MTKPRGRMTADEIRSEIERLARGGGEGSDKRWALKVLAAQEGDTGRVTLPPPMSDGEVVERLARLLRPAGKALTSAAVGHAFGAGVRLVVDPPAAPAPTPPAPASTGAYTKSVGADTKSAP